jgi:hypothetical protein
MTVLAGDVGAGPKRAHRRRVFGNCKVLENNTPHTVEGDPLMNARHIAIVLLGCLCLFVDRHIAIALNAQHIDVSPEKIRIHVTEQTLQKILSYLEEVSGIRFEFSRKIGQIPVTATITGVDWPTAVRALLKPFNTAEVWEGRRLSKVFIFDRGKASDAVEVGIQAREEGNQKLVGIDTKEPPPAALLPLAPPPPPITGTDTQ